MEDQDDLQPEAMDAQQQHDAALADAMEKMRLNNSRLPDLTNLPVDPAQVAYEELLSGHDKRERSLRLVSSTSEKSATSQNSTPPSTSQD